MKILTHAKNIIGKNVHYVRSVQLVQYSGLAQVTLLKVWYWAWMTARQWEVEIPSISAWTGCLGHWLPWESWWFSTFSSSWWNDGSCAALLTQPLRWNVVGAVETGELNDEQMLWKCLSGEWSWLDWAVTEPCSSLGTQPGGWRDNYRGQLYVILPPATHSVLSCLHLTFTPTSTATAWIFV